MEGVSVGLLVLGGIIALMVKVFVLPKLWYADFPGPKPESYLFGNTEMARAANRVIQLQEKWMREHGKTYQSWICHRRLIVTVDVENVRFCLLKKKLRKSEAAYNNIKVVFGSGLLVQPDPAHRINRRALSKVFHGEFVPNFHKAIVEELATLCRWLDVQAENGEAFEPETVISDMVGDATGRSLFGQSYGYQSGQHALVKDLIDIANEEAWKFILYPISKLLRPSKHKREILAEYRRRNQALLDARRRERAEQQTPKSNPDLLDALIESGRPDHEILGEIGIFQFAALDTTTRAITAALFELTGSHDATLRLQKEADGLINGSDLSVGIDKLDESPFSRAVWMETLRMHGPAGHGTYRTTDEDMTLPSGHFVPKNSDICFPMHLIHHDEDLWEEAKSFKPDRFLQTSSGRRALTGYQPFSQGERNCIGQFLANHVGRVTLLTFLRRYEWKLVGDRAKFGDFGDFGLRLSTEDGLESPRMTISRRH
uniref:Cytochrome P450 n=1 Tax=Rhodosorus marinus TaxID=101924 RepID=A0A6T6PQN6_9RHOD|mmetsp:Transcript_4206/g.5976  ORF Transcript_4206/g.5976 Transcript_4206/m.5976 type:complete len:486 (+) Transcript_4206:63-1520(+)